MVFILCQLGEFHRRRVTGRCLSMSIVLVTLDGVQVPGHLQSDQTAPGTRRLSKSERVYS